MTRERPITTGALIRTTGQVGPQGPAGATGAAGADGATGAAGAPGPSVARLIIHGHSYAWENNASPYGSSNPQSGGTRDGTYFTSILRDTLTPGATRVQTTSIPSSTTTSTTVVGLVPEDSVVEGVWFLPNGSVTGGTNTFKHEIQGRTLFGISAFGSRQYDSGTDLTQAVEQGIYVPISGGGTDLRAKDSSGTLLKFPFWMPSLYYQLSSTTYSTNPLVWKSTPVNAGQTDPGGQVLVRYGGRYRNLAQGGSLLLLGGVYAGGWGSMFAAHRAPQAFGVECNVSSSALSGSTNIVVDPIAAPIASGWQVELSNGVTVTTTSAAVQFTSVLAVATNHAAISAGNQGYAAAGLDGAYDAYTPEGVTLFCWGINDSAWWSPQDRSAWRETVRSVIALASCPYVSDGVQSNIVYIAGNGSGATWADYLQPAGGQWLSSQAYNSVGTSKRFTGAVGGTPPTITIKVAPAFEGGYIDLFFAALCGTNRGAQASITVDGTAWATLDTSSASPTANVNTVSATSTATSSTVTSSAGFNNSFIGTVIEKTGIPAGTIVNSVETTSSLTTSTNATASSTSTAAFVGYCPMVKRLGYLPAGTHTVVVTLTDIDATDKSAALIFMGYGLEVETPVLWLNVAQLPNGVVASNISDQNVDSQSVINGTAPVVGTGSTEPAFGPLVKYVDMDATLGGSADNFEGDSLHPNARGHKLIAELVLDTIRDLPDGVTLYR